MNLVSLGRTQLVVPQLAFGALPIQRVAVPDAVRLVRKAFDSGIRYFDTARAYSDSEEKLGVALADVRHQVIIATKTLATDGHNARRDLEASLSRLRTDYIDIIQLHNPEKVPDPADESSAYAALAAARREGLVRFIGVTNHRLEVASEAVVSGLFDTLQFPLSHISSSDDLSLIELCRKHDVGIIAMKALCGGLLTNIEAAFAFFRRLDNVVPIWGIQHEHELDQFLRLEQDPPQFTCKLAAVIEQDRKELAASFCRGCGYCLPCEAEIPIPMAARMSFLLRRAPYQQFLTEEWQQSMRRIKNCTECHSCAARCPYGLEPHALLKIMLTDYEQFASEHAGDAVLPVNHGVGSGQMFSVARTAR
jgi:aryl-alcohol dehydrogenase-like predicted oxidoreductase